MKRNNTAPATIDDYVAAFPEAIQKVLEKIRATVRKAAPNAEEAISYGMPTFKLEGNLVHFAAFKNHFGFYPTSSGTAKFKKELSIYEGSKGAVRFPMGKPIPFALIAKIVKFRVRENLQRAEQKGKKSLKDRS
jgi:uncharacterized protein YdhG (YjbR/CyaY superfamily)